MPLHHLKPEGVVAPHFFSLRPWQDVDATATAVGQIPRGRHPLPFVTELRAGIRCRSFQTFCYGRSPPVSSAGENVARKH